jgi:hypothetical protein
MEHPNYCHHHVDAKGDHTAGQHSRHQVKHVIWHEWQTNQAPGRVEDSDEGCSQKCTDQQSSDNSRFVRAGHGLLL